VSGMYLYDVDRCTHAKPRGNLNGLPGNAEIVLIQHVGGRDWVVVSRRPRIPDQMPSA